jgi:hypothetical protein
VLASITSHLHAMSAIYSSLRQSISRH